MGAAAQRQSGCAHSRRWSVIFPVLHGPFGEDGTVQGLLEMANIPYVGCGVLASAVCMDKELARRLFAAEGLPQPEYTLVLRNNWIANRSHVLDTIEGRLNYPLFIKPANLGSSVGISKAANRTALAATLDLAALYDRKLIVEAAVPHSTKSKSTYWAMMRSSPASRVKLSLEPSSMTTPPSIWTTRANFAYLRRWTPQPPSRSAPWPSAPSRPWTAQGWRV